MIPAEYNFTIYRGGTLNHKITAMDSEGVTVDFTDYTSMRLQVRPSWVRNAAGTSTDPLLELTSENGGINKADLNLALTINMAASATAAIEWDSGKYELELVITDVDPEVEVIVDKLLLGTITVVGEVTI